MAKKRVNIKKSSNKRNLSEDNFFDFMMGIIAFFVIEIIFMLGGLYLEKNIINIEATGIPSLLGFVIWFILGLSYSKKKYMFLGGLVTSILVPIILIIVTLTGFVSFSYLMYYSIVLFIVLELILLKILLRK